MGKQFVTVAWTVFFVVVISDGSAADIEETTLCNGLTNFYIYAKIDICTHVFLPKRENNSVRFVSTIVYGNSVKV